MVTRETSIRQGLAGMGLEPSDTAIRGLSAYAEILENRAIPEGYLGPNEGPRLLVRHVLESCALAPHLPDAGALIDVGSGAGLPGIPLACMRSSPTTLLESNERRAAFLREVVVLLELPVEVIVGRAEEHARSDLRDSFDAATCRALAPPAVALELCLPFVAVGGVFVWPLTPSTAGVRGGDASAPTESTTDAGSGPDGPGPEIATLTRIAGELGGGGVRPVQLEVPGADAARWAMIVVKLEPTSPRYPRRTGVPARRPLG